MNHVITLLLFAGLATGALARQPAADDATGRVIVIKMVDKSTAQWRFEPETVTVHPGDTIQWVQEDVVPHNVEFKTVPDDANLGDAVMGPFVFAKGEVYELKIDERFTEGLYDYICTPHDPLGMKASFTVAPASVDVTN